MLEGSSWLKDSVWRGSARSLDCAVYGEVRRTYNLLFLVKGKLDAKLTRGISARLSTEQRESGITVLWSQNLPPRARRTIL
jgi:hypothetical protein